MIDPALLTRLQKTDPETWLKFDQVHRMLDNVGFRTSIHHTEQICSDSNKFLRADLLEAWLQHVLQDAIREKDWSLYQISNPGLPQETYYADIYIYKHDQDMHHEAYATSPTEALLGCYLTAIEAQP